MPINPVDAPIAAVTIYTDRARVTRRGSCQLEVGEHTIALANLPTTIEEDSVRVSGRGANVKILGVEVVKQFITKPPEDVIAQLQEKLTALQDQDRNLLDQDAVETSRQEFLKRLSENSGNSLANGLAYGRANIDNVVAVNNYVVTELNNSKLKRREIEQQRRELEKEINVTNQKLTQLQRGEAKERRDIHVSIEVIEQTEFDFDISYAARGASWQPLYDIRLKDEQVNVTYLANIKQQTGEDWPAVELSLSTARPAVSTTIPELDPWYVDVYRPPMPAYAKQDADDIPVPQAARARTSGGAPPAAAAMPLPVPKPVAAVAKATVESSGAAVTYRVKRSIAVPNDGNPHRTTINVLEFNARLDYVTIPKLTEEAYLRAKITNSSEFALLPGTANIFHNNDFVGTTRLEMIAPNAEFEVQLGVDERVKVERKLIEHTTTKTLLGGSKRTNYAYKITLTNNLRKLAPMTVYDQVPLSRHEDIKIKSIEINPKPIEQNGLNIIKWELELRPQEKREMTIAFMLEHPRDYTLQGIS